MEPFLIQPTIIYDYPTAVSPLVEGRSRTIRLHVERFEFFAGGFELGNAFSELNDPVEQHKRFAEQLAEKRDAATMKPTQMDEDYVRALIVRAASDRRRGHRHRSPGDAADRLKIDSRRDPVPADAKQRAAEIRTGIRDQGIEGRHS